MKKNLPLICLVFFSFGALAQSKKDLHAQPAQVPAGLINFESEKFNPNTPKSILCIDTVRYPERKQALIDATRFFFFALWEEDFDAMSQAFLHSGADMTISGIEFFARVNPNSPAAPISVSAELWSLNSSNEPDALITSGSSTVSGTAAARYWASFSSPVVVSGNFALVITPLTSASILDVLVNDFIPGQPQDEGFSRYRSDFGVSNGNWVPVLTALGNQDFEMLVAPILSYNIVASYTAAPSPTCVGELVTFTNTSSPMSVLTNRIFTYGSMRQQFGGAVGDSTFAWTMTGVAPFTWSTNTTNTFNTAGTTTTGMAVLGGSRINGCISTAVVPITVNANPSVSLSSFENICQSSSPLTLSGGSPAGGTFTGTSVSAGTFNPSIGPGTYEITYTYTSPDNCSASATQSIVVEACLNLETWNALANLEVFPNPSSESFVVSFFNAAQDVVSISLIGADGKILTQKSAQPFTQFHEAIDVSVFASGIYLLQFETSFGVEVRKIIKN
jgi:hypothetical protein